jgi:hypothetical protein
MIVAGEFFDVALGPRGATAGLTPLGDPWLSGV